MTPRPACSAWRVRPTNRVYVGQVTGWDGGDGYRKIRIDGHQFLAHRLAWVYVYGVWPAEIDHVNGNRSDNRIANLRSVSHRDNQQNMRLPRSNNSSGYLGVHFDRGRWVAQIRSEGMRHRLGRFDTAEEASDAYLAAKRRLHPFSTIT